MNLNYHNINRIACQCAFFVGVGALGLLILIKLNMVELNKTKMNSIQDKKIELNISTDDATSINKVFAAFKAAKSDLTILESDIQKVELVENNSKVRIVPKANIENFSLPIELKIRK